MNAELAIQVIEEAFQIGVTEFCVCPGARMGPLYRVLKNAPSVQKYFWPEERSAAYFALGRAKASGRPVAVVTTSGTAAGELLPAAMEAYYAGIPLLLITADRPKRFRNSGAPQTAEQAGLFGVYAPFAIDIDAGEGCDLSSWNGNAPAHLNVCFEEPFTEKEKESAFTPRLALLQTATKPMCHSVEALDQLAEFLESTQFPLVVVGSLPESAQAATIDFLIQLNAPVFLEGISGLREEKRLQHLRVMRCDNILQSAHKSDYPIDALLRIGGVPTFRLWRDVEEKNGEIKALSINHVPFAGLSWGGIIQADLSRFLKQVLGIKKFEGATKWLDDERLFGQQLERLMLEEPLAEQSLMHQLSKQIASDGMVFLGNSLPIREWDSAATNKIQHRKVFASRGVNGIDGQISTFLGLCQPQRENWAIIGDLTALYDMIGPWILSQLPQMHINLVIINNSGGQIFNRFLTDAHFFNAHNLQFKPLADMWGLHYVKWTRVPEHLSKTGPHLIELVPDNAATQRLTTRLNQL